MSAHVYTANRKSNIWIISKCGPGRQIVSGFYLVYQSGANCLREGTVADPGFGQGRGGVPKFFLIFCWHSEVESGEWSKPISAMTVQHLPFFPWNSCIFNCQIYILPLYLIVFLQNLNLHLIDMLQNVHFQYQRFWLIFANATFLFLIWEIKRFIRKFLVHSDTEYRPIESPVSHLCRI